MKIFGIGLNKTGTTSLGAALEKLGFNGHISANLEFVKLWERGEIDSILKVSENYEIFEDWPWPLIYKDISIKYPDAKFVLTTRKSPEIWYESLCKHSIKTGPTEFRKIIYGYYMPHDFKKEHIDFYNLHNESVIKYFIDENKTRLLEMCFENGDGWKELIDFLNIKNFNINEIFPKLNTAKY